MFISENVLETRRMFSFFLVLTATLSLHINRIKAQTGGASANGDIWSCVPPGYCNNNVPPGINPRIVTPEACPAGMIQCFTQGPSSRCGERFVRQTNTDFGPADNGAYPWQAYIRNSTDTIYAGSGVLIDNYHVLTAAHKVAGDMNAPSRVIVSMGVSDPRSMVNVQNRSAVRIDVHRNYSRSNLINDIAIITVNPPFMLSAPNINSACLPGGVATAYVGQNCVTAGWGESVFNRKDHPVNPMKQVNVQIVNYTTCRASLGQPAQLGSTVDQYLDPVGEICAGGVATRDACTYDGGAPLTCPVNNRAYIAGLVIWGKSCGQPGVYGVYVSVPNYRGWIDSRLAVLNAG